MTKKKQTKKKAIQNRLKVARQKGNDVPPVDIATDSKYYAVFSKN